MFGTARAPADEEQHLVDANNSQNDNEKENDIVNENDYEIVKGYEILDEKTQLPEYEDKNECPEEKKEYHYVMNNYDLEKDIGFVETVKFLNDQDDGDSEEMPPKPKKKSFLMLLVLFALVALMFHFHLIFDYQHNINFKNTPSHEVPFKHISSNLFIIDDLQTQDDESTEGHKSKPKPHEIIAVGFPKRNYTREPVYLTVLVDHKFGNSWGEPAVVDYTPPVDIEYDAVFLKLKTSVDGVQYDRLANVFLNGVQIWRTSTIEPGGRPVYSQYTKDVSTYLSLFRKSGKFIFQLDNILTDRLTGEFKVELTVEYFNFNKRHYSKINPENAHENFNGDYSVLSTAKPADAVHPLVVAENKHDLPLSHLSTKKLQLELPIVPVNTTRLRLAIFTSGNAAEEFWYTNVLDKYADKFIDKHIFDRHGPVRIVNVFFNGEKIAAQTPEPVIFTGGISPALWNGVVSNSAFDVPAIEVDVSGLLPFLWTSQKLEDRRLEIEISNGLGETGHADSNEVGRDWITSASLLTYENSEVVAATGEVLSIDHNNRGSVVAFAPPFTGSILQIVNGIFSGQLISKFSLTLGNGKILNTTIASYTKGEVSNVQHYSNFGSGQSVVHVGHSVKSLIITDDDIPSETKPDVESDDHRDYEVRRGHSLYGGKMAHEEFELPANTIHSVNVSLSYPLVLRLTESNWSIGPGEFETKYNVKLVTSRHADILFNGNHSLSFLYDQNGTSEYFINKKGNHGFGALTSKFGFKYKNDDGKFKISRRVEAVNGTVVLDESKKHGFDDERLSISQGGGRDGVDRGVHRGVVRGRYRGVGMFNLVEKYLDHVFPVSSTQKDIEQNLDFIFALLFVKVRDDDGSGNARHRLRPGCGSSKHTSNRFHGLNRLRLKLSKMVHKVGLKVNAEHRLKTAIYYKKSENKKNEAKHMDHKNQKGRHNKDHEHKNHDQHDHHSFVSRLIFRLRHTLFRKLRKVNRYLSGKNCNSMDQSRRRVLAMKMDQSRKRVHAIKEKNRMHRAGKVYAKMNMDLPRNK